MLHAHKDTINHYGPDTLLIPGKNSVNPNTAGVKGANLFLIHELGLPTPEFIIIPPHLHPKKPEDFVALANSVLSQFTDPSGEYSVRACGSLQMPGILETVLKVPARDLPQALEKVYASWQSPAVDTYLELMGSNRSEQSLALAVQKMAYGDRPLDSFSGACYTRNPFTGEKGLYGRGYVGACGDKTMTGCTDADYKTVEGYIQKTYPELYAELCRHAEKLERHQQYPQEIEFVIEQGKLFILQTVDASLGQNELAILEKMEAEGLKIDIGKKTAAAKKVIIRTIYERDQQVPTTKITAAEILSPGIAAGFPVYTSQEAQRLKESGAPAIFIVTDTTTSRNDFLKALEENTIHGAILLFGNFSAHLATVCRKQQLPALRIPNTTTFDPHKPLILEQGMLATGPLTAVIKKQTTQLGKLSNLVSIYTPRLAEKMQNKTFEECLTIYAKALALQDMISPTKADEREIIISLIHDKLIEKSAEKNRQQIKEQALQQAFIIKNSLRYTQHALDKYTFIDEFYTEIFKEIVFPQTPLAIIESWLKPIPIERNTPHAELFNNNLVLGYEQTLGEIWDTAYEKNKPISIPENQRNKKLYQVLCEIFPEEKTNIIYYTNTYLYTVYIHDSHTEYRNVHVSSILCPKKLQKKIRANAKKIMAYILNPNN